MATYTGDGADLAEQAFHAGELKTPSRRKVTGNRLLDEVVQPGDTIFTILRHVSQSGMTRDISLVVIKDSEPLTLDYAMAQKGLGKMHRDGGGRIIREGIRVQGAGMDMGFHLVYELSRALFGDGYALNHRWL